MDVRRWLSELDAAVLSSKSSHRRSVRASTVVVQTVIGAVVGFCAGLLAVFPLVVLLDTITEVDRSLDVLFLTPPLGALGGVIVTWLRRPQR